ncbi:hypothetical protein IFR04_008332 [Cadophora malorum]|uniref:Uncharacterized protein n=1 Tax=Cadophora malorum TaxID=108018 RepID=A0A8H7WAN1_9HELO|nr:hypothetical protein IFR04_008332 [Cadophora malorum]
MATHTPPSPITPPMSPTRGLVSSPSPSPDPSLSHDLKKVFYNAKRSFDLTGLLQPTRDHDRQIALQYTRFKGFSAADLFDMEALAYFGKDPMPNGLTNAINPVFQLSQWETQVSLPKHRGAITLFGDHDSLWEWHDALLEGIYTEIKNPDPLGSYAASFSQRAPQTRNMFWARQSLNSNLVNAAKEIRFLFGSGMTYLHTGLPNGGSGPIYGHTLRNPYTGIINVTINIEYVQPLLRADLTEAEV